MASNRCSYCGESFGVELHSMRTRDHIVPIALGGKGLVRNTALACHWCNNHKRDRELLDWIRFLSTHRTAPGSVPARKQAAVLRRYMEGELTYLVETSAVNLDMAVGDT